MATTTSPNTTSPAPQPVSDLRVLIARLTWFILGPAMLLLMMARIVETGSGWFTAYDALFFVALSLIVLSRWYELRSGQGQDPEGHPANLTAFWPFLSWAVLIGVAVWSIANLLGNHLLS